MVNNYLIGRTNTTLDFDCIQHVSNTLLVIFTDLDGIEVIPLFPMRAGIDQDIPVYNHTYRFIWVPYKLWTILYGLDFKKPF